MANIGIELYGQGPANIVVDSTGQVIDPESKQKDDFGLTNPNLHRRLDIKPPSGNQISSNEYQFGIYGVETYRTKKITYHDEESTTSEIP